MQIDGHHTLTYVAARLAGFDKNEASVIAYSAQYVDDATNSGSINFDNKALYNRISSAHSMLDYRNSDELANHQVWIPFHFLPGNGGKPAGENPEGSFIQKIICKPNSHVAKDMLLACINDIDKSYSLHRLGITMHVYADTWAHQGFAGINNKINNVSNLKSNNQKLDESFFNKIANFFLSEAFPLGHGAALSHPDRPSLTWSYENGHGEKIERDNAAIFMEAVDYMCRAMQCFKSSDLTMDLSAQTGLPEKDAVIISTLINTIKGDSGEDRHQQWLEKIKSGAFSFGAEELTYIPKGIGSWKHDSIEQLSALDIGNEIFTYKDSFLSSNWKLFHDALQAHRFDILHDILPKYGICAG